MIVAKMKMEAVIDQKQMLQCEWIVETELELEVAAEVRGC